MLTFDDGPDPVSTRPVLDCLVEAGARATFFVWGEQAEAYPELVRDALAAGHSIQPHCWSHVSHWDLTPAEIEADLERVLRLLSDLGVPRPHLWRPPWGQVRPRRTPAIAKKFGLALAGWTLDTFDWKGTPAADMEQCLRAELITAHPDRVVLMHDGRAEPGQAARRDSCANTVELLRLLALDDRLSCGPLTHGLSASLYGGPSPARRALRLISSRRPPRSSAVPT